MITIEPAVSPGADGVLAATKAVPLCPGCRVRVDGKTAPNGVNVCVDTCHGTAPLVPPSAAVSPKMTPVQVPAAGYLTSTLP